MDTVIKLGVFAVTGLAARLYLKTKLKQMVDTMPEREHPVD
jgi:hypothetical protein